MPLPGSAGDGDGGEGGGARKVGKIHPYVQLSLDLAPHAGTILGGLALAAVVEHHHLEGELPLDTLETHMQVALARLPTPEIRVERLRAVVAAMAEQVHGLPQDLMDRAEVGYRQLTPADRKRIDLICHLDAPVIAGEVVVVLHELADYWATIEGALPRSLAGEGSVAGDLHNDLLQFFLTGAPWDLRTEVLSTAAEGGDLPKVLLSAITSAFTLRILERLRDTHWPKNHPVWSSGCSRYAEDPTVQQKIAALLTTWPVSVLWHVAGSDDDHEMQCNGEADFETAIWMVFEAMAGRRHEWPVHWLPAGPSAARAVTTAHEKRARITARVEQAVGHAVDRMANELSGFASWRDEVVDRVHQAAARDPRLLRYLRRHPAPILNETYAELRREQGSRRLLEALEYDVLLRLPANETALREEPLMTRRDPRGWSWFVASAAFARPETLEAVPDLSHDAVLAIARQLYTAYRAQLAVLDDLLRQAHLGEAVPLPLHLRHAIYMVAAHAVFTETARPETVRDPLESLYKQMVQADTIVETQDLPPLQQRAVQLGLLVQGAYAGKTQVDPQSPMLLGQGMATLAGMVFAGRISLQRFFDRPREQLLKDLHLAPQALWVRDLVHWLATEPQESLARTAFNAQWTANHPQPLEGVLLLVRNVLWVARTFGVHYDLFVEPSQGIAGLRLAPARAPISRVHVRETGTDPRAMRRIAALVEAVGAEIRAERRPAQVMIALATDDMGMLARWLIPALVRPETPHAGRVIVTHERGEGVPSRRVLAYEPPRQHDGAEVAVDLLQPVELAGILARLHDTLPADRAATWTVVAHIGERVERAVLQDPRLHNSIFWRLIDGDNRTMRWNGAALAIDTSSELTAAADAIGFDALIRAGRETHGWPALTADERREALDYFWEIRRERPHILHEYAARGWPLLVRRLITGGILRSRYLPVFLSRMAPTLREDDGPTGDLRHFQTYLSTDRFVALVHDEAAVLAEMRAQWRAFGVRVREAESVLRAILPTTAGATWADVHQVLETYAERIAAADAPERDAEYRAHFASTLAQARDRRLLHDLVSPRFAFKPTQEAIWERLQPLFLPDELASVVAARTKRTALSRLRTAWQRVVDCYFPEEELNAAAFDQHTTLWKLLHARFPGLAVAEHRDLLRLQRDLSRLTPDQRGVVIDLLGYGFTDAALDAAGIEIPAMPTTSPSLH